MAELTPEQKMAIDDMVRRRMETTGESKLIAIKHITNYLYARVKEN